ncbi:MAG: hypothetical protein KDA91_18360, partial [Planctomycetaceae bacterium]|nr:hypothetical protein [Planctomycetaceae bacterium]
MTDFCVTETDPGVSSVVRSSEAVVVSTRQTGFGGEEMGRCLSKALQLCFVILTVSNAASRLSAQMIYWGCTANDTIERAELSGSGRQIVIGPVSNTDPGLAPTCGGIVVDSVQDKIYWTDWGIDIVGVSNPDGSEARVLIDLRAALADQQITNPAPRGIAMDPLNQQLYWADSGAGTIFTTLVGGSEIIPLVAGLGRPLDVELDLQNGRMYWTENGGGLIGSANLDGTDVIRNTFQTFINPLELTLDVEGGYVYWTASGAIQRGDLLGSDPPITILEDPDSPYGLAFDPVHQLLYWSSYSTNPGSIHWFDPADETGGVLI